jgi:hypothetical protein
VKCVRNQETGEIRRVSDVKAMRLVIGGPWSYEKKSAWKAQQRAGAGSESTNE